MFLKLVFLLSVSTTLSHNLKTTPEDLRTYFKYVNTQVTALVRETSITIRARLTPLAYYDYQAKTETIQNLTEAAKPYWDAIRQLEETAQAQGQNISECTNPGNYQLYILNQTTVTQYYGIYDNYYSLGADTISYAASELNSVLLELSALVQVVDLCNDDVCADDLKKTATQYFVRAKSTLIDADTKASNYVFIYYPVLLANNQFDSGSYVANYTVILSDVTNCINNL